MFRALVEFVSLIQAVLLKGGWVILIFALYQMFRILYVDFINDRWYKQQKWVFLKITAPGENERSPLAFEHIFNQLHSIHATRTFAETYIEGQFQIWFTWELTSIGGIIGYYVRILEKHRDTLEAAIFSQFPKAEITETDDYFQTLPKYNTDTSEYDIFSTSLVLKNLHFYPIKTYVDFEHTAAETIVDPLTGVWEALDKLNPYEMIVIQYILRPISPGDWTGPGYHLIKKLKGEPAANEKPKDKIIEIINKVLGFFLDALIPKGESAPAKKGSEDPPSLMLHLSEGEKDRINAVERKLSKLAYQTKIRILYIAPREKYNFTPSITAIIGAFKSHHHTEWNSLKPDTDHWTKIRYWLFKNSEQHIHDLRLKYRKRRHMHMIRTRWYPHGRPPYVLNSEEIASLIHFPGIDVTVPRINKIEVAKVQPPSELPIAL